MKNRKNYEEMLEKLDTEISKKTQKNDEIDIQWLPLEPFDEIEIDSIASFPFAAMGELLGDAAKAISEGVQAPDALAGGSVLASASLTPRYRVTSVEDHTVPSIELDKVPSSNVSTPRNCSTSKASSIFSSVSTI